MRPLPRILPLAGVAIGGVLALNALSGARALPDLLTGAKAFAEQAAKPEKGSKSKAKAKEEDAKGAESADGAAKDAATTALPPPSIRPTAICAPTAAELAKEAGLSPAELQVLQSLGARRGQLDSREQQLDVQLALLSAAEAKLDAKVKVLNALKGDINGLLNQADQKEQTEIDRLVKVFEGMKAKDAAPRMVLLDDSVRLPIAAKMKERALSAILAQMPPTEAKRLTESLARRFTDARAKAVASVAAAAAPAPEPAKVAKAAPPKAPAKAAARKKAAPAAQTASTPAPAKDAAPPAIPAPKAG